MTETKQRELRKIIFEILLYFICFLLLTNAKIAGSLVPFGFGFLFALLYVKRNPFYFIPTFCLSYIITNPSIEGLIITFNILSVIVFAILLFKIIKKPMNLFATSIFALLSQVGFIFFNIDTGSKILETILSVVIGIIFMYTSVRYLTSIITKGFQSKLVLDEGIGLAFLIMAMSLGLFEVNLWGISLSSMIISLCILFIYYIRQSQFALYFASLAGIGLAFANSSIIPLAIFCSWAIGIMVSSKNNKYISAIAILMIDALLGIFFNAYINYTFMNFLSVAITSVIFVCIPNKALKYLQDYFSGEHKLIAEGYMANINQEDIKFRLKNISNIFFEMQNHYRRMIVGEMNYEEVKEVLTEQVIQKVCLNCEKNKNCHKFDNKNVRNAICQMVYTGLKKKKITLVDMPSILASCGKPNTVLASTNQVLGEFFEYENLLKKEDSGKIIVGEQLFGAGELIKKLSESINKSKRVGEKRENQLINDLLYSNVIVRECAIYEGDNGFDKAVLLIRNHTVKTEDIEKIASEFFKLGVKITISTPSVYSGWKVVVLEQAPRFDILFGKANQTKTGSESSGDTYSFVNLGNNKYMISLCDGMGSGKNAERTSEFAISLIENFYRAGFDSTTTLSAVNKLLSSTNKENFNAIDVCIIDTINGKLDFIKLGSSPSAIKKTNTAELVVSENLPLGIIDNTKPTIVKKFLSSGDIVILASDGVYDTFEREEAFLAQINNERLINMSMLAENLIEDAISRSGGIKKDDMTVLALRLIQNA